MIELLPWLERRDPTATPIRRRTATRRQIASGGRLAAAAHDSARPCRKSSQKALGAATAARPHDRYGRRCQPLGSIAPPSPPPIVAGLAGAPFVALLTVRPHSPPTH